MSGLGFKLAPLLAITLLLGCLDPDDPPVYSNYLFNLEFDIQPAGNLYAVGDTIMVKSNIGCEILDENSQQYISTGETFLFPVSQGFFQYDTSYIQADSMFEVIPVTGFFSDTQGPATTINMWYEIDAATNNRELEYFFIPLTPGIYTFHLSYTGTDYYDGFLDNGDDWKSEAATLDFSVNGREYSGYELLEQTEYYEIITQEEHERDGRYTFEVVE